MGRAITHMHALLRSAPSNVISDKEKQVPILQKQIVVSGLIAASFYQPFAASLFMHLTPKRQGSMHRSQSLIIAIHLD